jgi:hypothetical protein
MRGAMALNKELNGDWKNLEQLVDRIAFGMFFPTNLGRLLS